MKVLLLTETDLLIGIIATSGLLAGLLAYLMVPSLKRERQNCIKSMLFGIVFSLVSYMLVHALVPQIVYGVPQELHALFSWCVSFLPALLMSLTYGVVVRRKGNFEI